MSRRAAVYNRFWHSQGGGERHSGMIAAVLSHDGVEVDLIGHTDVDKDELADHLGLDLSRCRMRIVPDRGDRELSVISSDYDLLVNGSYMSRLLPRSRRSAYLCYFPTPFDSDMARWRQVATRTFAPMLRSLTGTVDYGTGWFPPEGGRRRQWAWSNGDGILTVPATDETRRIRMDLGAPGRPGPTVLRLVDESGALVADRVVSPQFERHYVAVPAAPRGMELHLQSTAFQAPGTDTRTLGVAVSRLRLEGGRRGPRARMAYRFPWLLRDPADISFLGRYDAVLVNSHYTRGWVERLWHSDSEVLYPPIQVQRLTPSPEREKTILSVGRFFPPHLGHAKRQLEMVRFFRSLHHSGRLPGWQLVVVGGCEPSRRPYLEQVQREAEGLPVTVLPNAPRAQVERLLSTASVFWSATGYGSDEERMPWAQEHFGMTTVEAMAGGCVPVVIDRAGQREIVRDGIDGYRWNTPDQLLDRTAEVAHDESLRARLSASATARAATYDEPAFADRWHAIVAAHHLLD